MLSVWHVVSQEELKFARLVVVLGPRAGVGVPRTGRRREREGERERRRRRGTGMGCMFFFLSVGFGGVRGIEEVGGGCVMFVSRGTRLFEGMEGKDENDGKNQKN